MPTARKVASLIAMPSAKCMPVALMLTGPSCSQGTPPRKNRVQMTKVMTNTRMNSTPQPAHVGQRAGRE